MAYICRSKIHPLAYIRGNQRAPKKENRACFVRRTPSAEFGLHLSFLFTYLIGENATRWRWFLWLADLLMLRCGRTLGLSLVTHIEAAAWAWFFLPVYLPFVKIGMVSGCCRVLWRVLSGIVTRGSSGVRRGFVGICRGSMSEFLSDHRCTFSEKPLFLSLVEFCCLC